MLQNEAKTGPMHVFPNISAPHGPRGKHQDTLIFFFRNVQGDLFFCFILNVRELKNITQHSILRPLATSSGKCTFFGVYHPQLVNSIGGLYKIVEYRSMLVKNVSYNKLFSLHECVILSVKPLSLKFGIRIVFHSCVK